MRPFARFGGFAILIAVAVGLLTSACVSVRSVAPADLDPEWKAELTRPHPPPIDLSGTYLDAGLLAPMNYNKTRKLEASSLSRLMFKFVEKDLPSADEVQLVQHGQDRLECFLRRSGQVVWSTQLKIEIDVKTGLVALPGQTKAGGSGIALSAGVGYQRLHLLKGSDGCLYAHPQASGAGVFLLIPLVQSGETWARWKPSARGSQTDGSKP